MTSHKIKKAKHKTLLVKIKDYWGKSKKTQIVVKLGIAPAFFYFALFCMFTWPWITHFNGWFFQDSGDGLQNVWNMWWIDKSVTDLNQLPWHTSYLHAPYGVTLVGQTLNPINGFIGIVLQQFMSLTQAFNTMVTFAFVFGGLSMFWLCRYFTKNYVASLIGGAIFTFSSYHFSHAIGHMQLVSLEFVPLYVLLWWMFLKKPTYTLAAGTTLSLALVLFCDYYYFMYSVMISVMIFIYFWWRKDLPNFKQAATWRPLLLLILLCLALVAPLPLALLLLNSNETLQGYHDARVFSTDLVTPFLNGGFWRFNELTVWYYHSVKGFVSETTVYLGISVLGLLSIAIWKRTKIHRDIVFWLFVAVFFGVMSLGPRPLIYGNTIESIPMPYTIMEHFVPGMRLSGVPVRMMFMVTFASAIIAAMVLAKINLKSPKGKALIALFSIILILEMLPGTLPLTPSATPPYIAALKSLPDTGAVLDNAAKGEPQQLFHQTIHEKRMILGYISRTPESLIDKEEPMIALIGNNKLGQLCSKYGLRYITTPAKRPLSTNFPAVYRDQKAIIYDLKNDPGC